MKNFSSWNVDASDLMRRGLSHSYRARKVDLDNFYGNVPRQLARTAIKWAIARYLQKFGNRRKVICVPRIKYHRSSQKSGSFCRSFSGHYRNLRKDTVRPRFQCHRSNSKDYWVASVDDLVIELDYRIGLVTLKVTAFEV